MIDHARLLRSFVKVLDSIQEQIKAVSQYAAAHQKPKEPAPPRPPERISAEVNFPPEVSNRYYSEQDKTFRLQRRTFWVGLLTLLALIAYTVITYRQWRALLASNEITKISAEAAKSAASTANETLKDARKSFVLEQRPYLIAETPMFARTPDADRQPIAVNVTFKNIGRTPTIKRRTQLDLLRFRGIAKTKDSAKLAGGIDRYFKFIEGAFDALSKRADDPGGKYGPLAREDVAPGAQPFSTAVNETSLTADELTDCELVLLTCISLASSDTRTASREATKPSSATSTSGTIPKRGTSAIPTTPLSEAGQTNDTNTVSRISLDSIRNRFILKTE